MNGYLFTERLGGTFLGYQHMGVVRAETVVDSRVHLDDCQLCEHRCGANRLQGERGPCKAGPQARVFRHRVESGEELQLIPSHLFYLSGCDLRCSFCIAEENAFNPHLGQLLTVEFLTQAIAWGIGRGARNLQWVGGEPTIHIPAILEIMHGCRELPPIVWKSDFYGTPEALALLSDVVDIYVVDLKFGNDTCATRISKVHHYFETVTRNLLTVAGTTDLIVRHLLLPGHFECCFHPIVEWMHDNLPQAKFSIRDGYLPKWQARHSPDLAQPLDRHHASAARELAARFSLNVVV